MKDGDYDAAKQRVKKIVQKWTDCCGLKIWQRVTINYCEDAASMARDRGVSWDDYQQHVAGATSVDWQYRQADIFFNLARLFTMTDEEIDYVVRHEIAHLLLNEMREWQHGNGTGQAMSHEERVATELAMVMGWIRQAGQEEKITPRKKKHAFRIRRR